MLATGSSLRNMWHMRYSLLLLFLLASTAAAQVRVETIDGVVKGDLAGLTPEAVVLRIGGKRRTFELSGVFRIQFDGSPRTQTGTMFRLVGGDVYRGTLSGGDLDELVVETHSCGQIKLRTDPLTELRFPLSAEKAKKIRPVPEKKDQDVIYLKNGDHAYGRLDAVEQGKDGAFTFAMKTNVERVAFRAEKIYRIRIAPLAKAPTSTKFHALIQCWDGTQFRAELTGFGERILLAKTLFGDQRKVALSAIRSIHFMNGRFVYLTDRSPSKVEHIPYFVYRFEPKFDLNRRGGPLMLGGKQYEKGIGMQSRTLISYKIAGEGFKRFRCLVGIDDAAGDGGSVIFRVLLDGKKVHETKVLRGGDPAVALNVPLGEAQTLTLEADYADNAHVNDLADWVNPVLLR